MILWCRVCHGCYTEPNMKTDDLCIKCWANEELKKEGGENHKTKEGAERKVLPGKGERETKSMTPRGQMELCLIWD